MPLKLESGANSGWLILSAATNASAWIGPLKIVGSAKIGEKQITRAARAGAVGWNIGDYSNDSVASQLTQELLLAVSGSVRPSRYESTGSESGSDPDSDAYSLSPLEWR